jgi:hypothetical protein
MMGDRTEAAVQRIEAALARIARAADAPPPAGQEIPIVPRNVLALVERHESLREVAAHTLNELDAVIAELDQ